MTAAPPLVETTDRWQVLHTRARCEKAVARSLAAARVEHYLPLRRRVAYHGSRKRIVEEPVFASYVFLRGPREAAFFAVTTKRVANVLPVPDQDGFEHDLRQLRLALEHGADLLPAAYLAVGQRARVIAGPFRGLEGLIEDRRNADRLLLQVAALGQATSLEIDTDLLEPVSERD
jgi:transcription antitermination factor NusG